MNASPQGEARFRANQGGRRMRPVRAHEAVVISAECTMGRWTTHPPGYVRVTLSQEL
jgi:hypothetical protein